MSEPNAELNGPEQPLRPEDVPLLDPSADDATRVSPGNKPADDPSAAIQRASEALPDQSPTIISSAPRRRRPDEAIAADLRGKRLAHFELLEPIGVGGMAAVIRAQDKQLDRCVALKILPPQMATDPESIRRFHQEARSAARLDHENIARVFFCGEDQGLHFIAFEFVEGENLRTILEQRGRIPTAETIHYLLQVATGLAHAAARGVVHRDIKPSNIIITPAGRAKLVDMGLARSLGPQAEGELTHSGVTLGTFDYISPEQALEPRDADARSDIYSLGCTFYHMLTGQPPVPEGTAAKKLHHHQHVPPIDPRQLDSHIPDDVAAVLARMMAKDPKDRYQTPEHLVQHLVHLAKKLGCADVPEGVLCVEAPLPDPPRARPLLIGTIAAAVIVGLVVLLGSISNSSVSSETNPDLPPGKVAETAPPGGEKNLPPTPPPIKPPGGDPVPVPEEPAKPVLARNTRELANYLKQKVVRIELAADHYDLRAEDFDGEAPGLVFRGTELTLEPANAAKRPTISLKYNPSVAVKNPRWAALTVRSGQVHIQGVRFEIDAAGTDTAMAALAYQDGTLRVKNCEFVQTLSGDAEQRHTSSVRVETAAPLGSGRQNVSLEGCFFAGGHEAVLLTRSAGVAADNCAFGPHASLFCFRGPKVREAETDITVANCSAMLRRDQAAFHLDAGGSCRLAVNHCLFSCPPGASDVEGEGAVLVRQTGDAPGYLHYEGHAANVYHNLTDFWLRETRRGRADIALDLAKFKDETHANRADRWLDWAINPWRSDRPLALLETQPKQAFQVNPKVPELRQEKDRTRPVGVRSFRGLPLNEALPPVEDLRIEPVVRKTKIVDPGVTESGQGRYPTLRQALGDARPGDTILVRHDGLLAVDPVLLDKPTVDVTIRPAARHHPVLTLGETSEPDAALFRLHDGKLNLVDLAFRLRPQQAAFKAQAVVMLAGDGQCTFKNCLATLEASKEVRVALVTLADPSAVMKMAPPNPQLPRMRLENCFVRGDGDLVTVRASRPFQLDVEDALLALDGSLLVVDGNLKEVPAKPARVSLKQVTAYLGEHLILLRAAKDEIKQGLVQTEVSSSANCLFHSARGAKSLVRLEGVDTDEQMRRLFTWDGTQNLYSSFASMLDQQPRGDNAVALPPYDQERWETLTKGETERRFAKVKFTSWPVADRPLARSWPMHFRVKEPDAGKCGAPIDRLPRPAGEEENGPAVPDGE